MYHFFFFHFKNLPILLNFINFIQFQWARCIPARACRWTNTARRISSTDRCADRTATLTQISNHFCALITSVRRVSTTENPSNGCHGSCIFTVPLIRIKVGKSWPRGTAGGGEFSWPSHGLTEIPASLTRTSFVVTR